MRDIPKIKNKKISIIFCYMYYFSGVLSSKLMHLGGHFGHLYFVYNWLMSKSVMHNNYYNLDVWKTENNRRGK